MPWSCGGDEGEANSGRPMLDPKESRFWQSTILSGLMDAQGLTACWNAIPPGKRDDPKHIDRRLARQAVQAQALSLWQAQQIIAGRTAGFKVDRYVLVDLIGQGGMGRVYLAQDTRLNREVALKILSPERVNNPRAIARFQREARVGAQLQHENLVRIYDFGESSGRYYLVMEYIEGKTIGTLISEQGAMSPSTAVKLVRQVALGLDHAYRKGLVHRDVNPYNILVTRDGTAKLADLGLAIDLAEDDRVTREGATVGTFDYVAPEQARHSHSADIRSDIYSLGCSLYHMCSGQVPFPTPSLPEKLFAHQAMEPTPLGQLVPNLAPGLSEVVHRMMSKSPEDRYATPLQAAQALESYEHEHSVATDQDNDQHATPETGVVSPSAAADDAPLVETGAEPRPTGIAVAEAVRLKPVPDPAANHNAESNVRVPSTVLSPGSGQGSDPEFPIDLILAPEPSLTEGLSRPKTRSSASNPGSSSEGISLSRLPRNWIWVLLAITAFVFVLAGILAVVNPFADTAAKAKKLSAQVLRDKPGAAHQPDSANPIAPIVVRSDGGAGTPFAANKLFDAMKTALGSRGWVELRNREPLKLISTGNTPLDFRTASGTLAIRAAEGTEPVIDVTLNGSKPLLELGSGVTLKLSGVTIVVHYPKPAVSTSPAPPAVLTTASSAKIDRCAFKVAPGPHPKGCSVVQSNIGVLEVDRCWFEGFDSAIEVAAELRTSVRIKHTMIVRAPVGDSTEPSPGEGYGWGVKLRFESTARPQSKAFQANFLLDHCTLDGAGLFDLTDSPGPASVRVEVNRCVLDSNTLLAVNPKRPSKEQIEWRGDSNYYDVVGRSWIVNSASQGTPLFSAEAIDLDGWAKFVGQEKDLIRAKLKYRIDPSARGEPLQPRDFAIEESAPLQSHPHGADAKLVGPWSPP
jgi:eukaryotic-like serine/threonine-protein kinase